MPDRCVQPVSVDRADRLARKCSLSVTGPESVSNMLCRQSWIGYRSFMAAGPQLWNNLPIVLVLQQQNTVLELKTFLLD